MIARALTWLASPQGRLIAAVLLFILVGVLERTPGIAAKLDGKPMLKRGLAIGITVAGAAATALWAGVPLTEVGQAAVTAFLSAAGLNACLPGKLGDRPR